MSVSRASNTGGGIGEIFKDKQKLPMQWDDIRNLVAIQMESRYKYIIDLYKNYFMRTKDREEQLKRDGEEWRTNIKSPLTFQYTNAAYGIFLDSDVKFTAIDVKGQYGTKNNDDRSVTEEMVDMAHFLYSHGEVREEMLSAVFDAILLGYGYLKDNFIFKKDVVRYRDSEGTYRSVNVEQDFPTIEYVSPFSIFYPPNTKTIKDSRMIIERKLMPISTIEKKYAKYGLKVDEKAINERGEYISYIDYEAIKVNMPFYNNAEGTNILEDDKFNIKNKFCEILEVRTKEYNSIFINGIYHGTRRVGVIHNDYPYYVFNFKKIPGVSLSIGLGYIVKPLQQSYDELLNARQDSVKMSQNKMLFVDPKVDMFGKNNVGQLGPGKIFKVRDPQNSILPFEMNGPGAAEYTEVNAMFEMTETATGISGPMLGSQRKVERSATGSELLKNSTLKQMKPLLDSVAGEFARIMKHWMINSLVYMKKSTFDEILGEDNKLKDMDIEKIVNDFDFNFEMMSMKSQSLTVEREQLMQLLQMSNMFVTPGGRQLIDIQKVLDRLLETFNFDNDMKLEPEEFQKMLAETQIAQQEAKQDVQQNMQEQSQGGGGQGNMANLQRQMGGGGVPPEQSTNPSGSNLPSNEQ